MAGAVDFFGFDPSELPPSDVGVTLPLDVVLGRSDSVAVVVRSAVVFRQLIHVRTEVIRAPDLSEARWSLLVRSVQTTLSKPSTLRAAFGYAHAPSTPLRHWADGSDGKQVRMTFWGSWNPRQVPTDLHVDFNGEIVGNVAFPAAIFNSAARSERIW
jgi:hypothetical protein